MITSENVEMVTEYRIGKDFTQNQFEEFLGSALDKFSKDDPGLPPHSARRAVSLLVGHYIAQKKGDLNKTQEKFGNDYQVTKGGIGQSSYMVEYLELVTHPVENERQIPSCSRVSCARNDTDMGSFIRARWRP